MIATEADFGQVYTTRKASAVPRPIVVYLSIHLGADGESAPAVAFKADGSRLNMTTSQPVSV